jgi:hypothetical protein
MLYSSLYHSYYRKSFETAFKTFKKDNLEKKYTGYGRGEVKIIQ